MSKIKNAVIKRLRLMQSTQFPINRIIGKHLARSGDLHHQELLDKYDEFGRRGYDWKETSYFSGAASPIEDHRVMFPRLPSGLKKLPVWWMMPWALYPQKKRKLDQSDLENKVLRRIDEFFDLYESIKKYGYTDARGGAIAGFFLEHPRYGVIFNQIDGHHRLAILNHLNRKGDININNIAVFSLDRVHRDSLANSISFNEGIRSGYFTRKDAFLLFDNCFQQLDLEVEN